VSGENPAEGVAERYRAVLERIEAACQRSGRSPGQVRLVGVSKRQPPERIVAAVRAGLRELGENFVQETRDRQPLVQGLLSETGGEPPIVPHWRMIGRLQRNKARLAVELFDAVDSVDRIELARELDRRAGARGRPLEVCLQVDVSNEAQKGGVAPDDLPRLLGECSDCENLRVVGLMTIPAAHPDPESTRPAFARLRELRDTLASSAAGTQLRELSMGMSSDFEVAVEEGATLVRVGTAIFGPRA
jgi:pyridoxal phosphate enzyme (YggS family)